MTEEELLAALELDDSYSLVRTLAQHGVGATELVTDAQGTLLVRKKIPRELANVAAWRRLATVDDPRLPHVVQIYELPDEFVVVCSYTVGMTVAQILSRHIQLEPLECLAIARGVCEAAQVLHDMGIVHRDISPGNVVVTPNVLEDHACGRVCLIDLGLARLATREGSHDTTVLGTRGFSAPEQYGFTQTDARSDIYSIGRLLLCLMCGQVVDDISLGRDRLAELGISPEVADIISKACAFEPSGRYQSAKELAGVLARAEQAMGADPTKPLPMDETAVSATFVVGARRSAGGSYGEVSSREARRYASLVEGPRLNPKLKAALVLTAVAALALFAPGAVFFVMGVIGLIFPGLSPHLSQGGAIVGVLLGATLLWMAAETYLYRKRLIEDAASAPVRRLLARWARCFVVAFVVMYVVAMIARNMQ